MTSNPGQNGTTTPFYIRPDNSLPVHTRDTYLLIATFVSVLIIMGIVIAFINRKCRNSLSRARFRLLHLRHHDALTTGRRRRQLRSTEVPAPHMHSLHDPNSPVYSKAVNVSVTSHPKNGTTPSRVERVTGSWDSEHESGSGMDPDSGISVVSSKTVGSNCSTTDLRSNRDKMQKVRKKTEVAPSPGNQLVKVLMPETVVKDSRLSTSSNVNRHVRMAGQMSTLELKRNRMRDIRPQRNLKRVNVYSENSLQGPRILGSGLDELDQHSSFDVISVDSSELSFDENLNRLQLRNDHQMSHCAKPAYKVNSIHRPSTQRNVNQTGLGKRPLRLKSQRASVPKHLSSTFYPSIGDQTLDNPPPLAAGGGVGDTTSIYRQPETRAGLHGLLPSLQEFVDFLQERRRKLSFTSTEERDDRF